MRLFLIAIAIALIGMFADVHAIPSNIASKEAVAGLLAVNSRAAPLECKAFSCTNGDITAGIGQCESGIPSEHQFEMNVVITTNNVTKPVTTPTSVNWSLVGFFEVDGCTCDLKSSTSSKQIFLPHYSKIVQQKNSRESEYTSSNVAALTYERDMYEKGAAFVLAKQPQVIDTSDPKDSAVTAELARDLNSWFNHGFYMPLSADQYLSLPKRFSSFLVDHKDDKEIEALVTGCLENIHVAAQQITPTLANYDAEGFRVEKVGDLFRCTIRTVVRSTGPAVADMQFVPTKIGARHTENRNCEVEVDPFISTLKTSSDAVVTDLSTRSTIRKMLQSRTNPTGPATVKVEGTAPPKRLLKALAKKTKNQNRLFEQWKDLINENAVDIQGSTRYDTSSFKATLKDLPAAFAFQSKIVKAPAAKAVPINSKAAAKNKEKAKKAGKAAGKIAGKVPAKKAAF